MLLPQFLLCMSFQFCCGLLLENSDVSESFYFCCLGVLLLPFWCHFLAAGLVVEYCLCYSCFSFLFFWWPLCSLFVCLFIFIVPLSRNLFFASLLLINESLRAMKKKINSESKKEKLVASFPPLREFSFLYLFVHMFSTKSRVTKLRLWMGRLPETNLC